MFAQMTKIVALCLISTLVACSKSERPARFKYGVGSDSKIGMALTSRSWCLPSKSDSEKRVVVDQFTFGSNGELKLSRYALTSNSTTALISEEKGKWAVLGDQLFLLKEKSSQQMKFSPHARQADGAQCFDLITDQGDVDSAQEVCPCETYHPDPKS